MSSGTEMLMAALNEVNIDIYHCTVFGRVTSYGDLRLQYLEGLQTYSKIAAA